MTTSCLEISKFRPPRTAGQPFSGSSILPAPHDGPRPGDRAAVGRCTVHRRCRIIHTPSRAHARHLPARAAALREYTQAPTYPDLGTFRGIACVFSTSRWSTGKSAGPTLPSTPSSTSEHGQAPPNLISKHPPPQLDFQGDLDMLVPGTAARSSWRAGDPISTPHHAFGSQRYL